MDDELFLGKVFRNEANWARMEPLAVRVAGQWKRIDDAVEMFPKEGKIFSTRGLPNAPTDSLWTFTRRPNELRDLHGPDLLLAEEIVRATPIVDLSSVSLEMARRRLFNEGVHLPLEYNSATAVALLSDDLFCDVTLTRSADGLWRSNSLSRPVQLKQMPNGWKSSLDFNGLRVIPAQTIPHATVIRTVNWCSDQDFIERVIDRFRKFMQGVGDTSYARPSRDAVKYISRALRQAELMPGEDNGVVLDMERLRTDWPILEARLEASEELASLILDLKSTKDKVAAATELATRHALEEARPSLERQVREETQASLTEARRQRDELSEEVLNLEQRRALASSDLAELERLCNERREQQKAILDGLSAVASELRIALAQSPVQGHPALSFIAERLEGMLTQHGYRGPSLIPPAMPPWGTGMPSGACNDIRYGSLTAVISEEAKRHGIDESALRLTDIFARAGELVLLCGPQAELTLRAYARCISAGVYRTMALDPSIIGLDDLWRAPGTQTPTAFAHAWQAALGAPDCFHILCVRDIDAAPYRLWLASFQTVLQSASRPTNLLVFATTTGRSDVQSGVGSPDDSRSGYLVPVFPGVHEAGAVAALASTVAPVPPPCRLSVAPDTVQSVSVAGDWLTRVVTFDLPPGVLARLARFRNQFIGDDAEHLMTAVQGWGQFLGSRDAASLPSTLRDGYKSMAN